MSFLSTTVQLILSLSILVVLHEMGHYLPARWFKTRVEKFYLFFDFMFPLPNVLNFSLFKKKIGDTEWGLGWFPFGGYVKIAGMVDESMDKDQLAKPAEPWEFRSKPAWQRLIIIVGGVTVNLILGLVLYIMILFVWGRDYLPLENVTYGISPSATMQAQGIEPGDRIVAVPGHEVRSLDEVGKAILINEARELVVLRNGERKAITLSVDVQDSIMDKGEKMLFLPRVPFVIDSIMPNGTALATKAFRKGDRIVALDGTPTLFADGFIEALAEKKGSWAVVSVWREGDEKQPVHIPVAVSDKGKIGLANRDLDKQFTLATERYSFFQAIPAGIRFGLNTLGNYVNSLKLVFSSSGVKQMGGFGSIGGLFGEWGDWQTFWGVTALLSIILAFMNILPIPMLDGGHMIFILWEMITRRAPSQKVMEVAQMVGMVLLFSLIIFANGNDLFKAITGK
jgi:regulator of sigma E protease